MKVVLLLTAAMPVLTTACAITERVAIKAELCAFPYTSGAAKPWQPEP